jgi:hypothetical protein
MADNTTLNPGTAGDVIATDDVAGVKYPRTKIQTGADGVAGGDVTPTNPFDVRIGDATNTVSVKAASTAAVAGDKALVVGLHPTSPLPTGANTIGTVNIGADPDTVVSGTISAVDAVVGAPAGTGAFVTGTSTASSYVVAACPGGDSAWNLQLTGTFGAGTIYFEESLDSTNGIDGNWINVNGRQTGVVNTVLGYSTTTAGFFRGNTSGSKYFRARNVGGVAPTIAVVIRMSSGTGAIFLNASIPAGTNTIGAVKITDSGGFNIMPTMDVVARAAFQKLTDGASTVSVKAASTAAVAGDSPLVVALHPTSPLPAGSSTIGIVNQGTAAAVAGGWPAKITDGTNTAAVKAASTAALTTDPALVVAMSPNYTDLSATGALGALNATVVLNAAGASGIGLAAPGGSVTLIGTLVAEASFDGGSSWAQTFFGNTVTGQKSSSYVSASGVGISFSIMPCSGASVYRVRVSAYTSGTATATLRSSTLLDTSMFYGSPPGGSAPAGIQMGGRDGSFAFQYAEIRPSVPTAAVQGLVVRPFMGTDGTNTMPTGDAVARAVFQKLTDGANTAAVLAATIASTTQPALVVRPYPFSDGTNVMPVMAGLSTRGFMQVTDGTSSLTIKAASVAAAAVDPALVVSISPNNGVRITDLTNFMPTGDVAARAIFHKNTDGTNTAAVKAASTAAVATDPAMVVAVSPTTPVITVQQTATAGTTQPASSITSVTILGTNSGRKGACIYNDSTSAVYVLFGATASATVFTVKLAAGAYYEVPFGYTGIITGIWVTANGNARVTEIT